MTKREEAALEVLRSGGYFRKQLETTYRGHEQFVVRLRSANGAVVSGVGAATLHQLEAAGLLRSRECASSSVWPQEWALAGQGA
jgi:hypothetical protein